MLAYFQLYGYGYDAVAACIGGKYSLFHTPSLYNGQQQERELPNCVT